MRQRWVLKLAVIIGCLWILVAIGMICVGFAGAQGVLKYNPLEDRWEATYPDSQLRLTPDGGAQYITPRTERPDYGDRRDRAGRYDWQDTRDVQPLYNFDSGRWEYPR